MSGATRFLLANGVVLPPGETPPVSTLLEAHPGAYTTTRTHAHTLLFFDRHARRLSHSLRTLLHSNPNLLFGSGPSPQTPSFSNSVDFEKMIRCRLQSSLSLALPTAMEVREFYPAEELAVTALVAGNPRRSREVGCWDAETVDRVFDVFVHIGMYAPLPFGADGNCARLAIVRGKRDLAVAKYSDWARVGKGSRWRVCALILLLSCCCPMMVIGFLKELSLISTLSVSRIKGRARRLGEWMMDA